MVITYILLLIFACVLALLTNYLRYKVGDLLNKWIFVIASILLIVFCGLIIHPESQVIIILFILITASSFKIVGGLAATLVGWFLYTIQIGDINLFFLLGYLCIGVCVGFFSNYMVRKRREEDEWTSIIIRNSKQLSILREISAAIQDTYELDKILQIIATSVTAGHGLGFNRSMILLVDDDESRLIGVIGVGPMSAEEGYKTWENITENKYRLVDLIELQEKDTFLDLKLNEYVKRLQIDLNHHQLLSQVLEKGEPVHIQEIDITDEDQQLLSTIFSMEEFVAFPLINRGTKVGVLVIDNPVNKKPITNNEVDSVIPIANQAAIAIEQARLYAKVEDMALRDGLTGLMNHRAFQTTLDKIFPANHQTELSFIMIDIDSFKHYNDTNGHLLGNHVLFQVANVIKDSVRNSDYSFRFGGEEFVVLLPNTSIDQASQIAESIRLNVKNTPFPNGENQPNGYLTISLGVASTKQLMIKSSSNLIDTADQALYQAKNLGRDRVITYEEANHHE